MVKIDAGDWVVVCDGAKALILENAGDERFPNLRTREVHTQADAATREEDTAAPPRTHQSKGVGRSGVVHSGGQDSERSFLVDLAGRLDAALGAGDAKAFVLVAPPRALGMIREAYSPALQHAIRAELDKDYVNMPVHEIEKRLTA
ncbi:MAG TPA: host attachment protein [Xanthobacteraceae bacterium]|nr:host attachment protein [Xanthobacteraceae bacterium]